MNRGNPAIAIIGAGAVGTYYGARLAQHGQDVHFLLRSDYDTVAKNGMVIQSCAGDFSLTPNELKIYRDVREMPKADCVIVTLKTTSNELFEPLIRPLIKDETDILTLQNGLGNEDQLAGLFGAERILGGMAFTCINRIGPGVIAHTSHGYIRIGEFRGGPSERASVLSEMFNQGNVPCDVLPSLAYGRWEKLLWNFPFNGLSAVLDQTTDRLLSTPQGEQLVEEIMREVIAAAGSDGVTLPASLIPTNISRTHEMGAYRTSMHIDRQMRRPMEVEAILGEPVRRAAANGIATPCMKTLYHLAAMTAKGLIRRTDRPRATTKRDV